MRAKLDPQSELNFHPSNLRLTNEYYQKYEAVSTILDENPRILGLVHEDLKEELESLSNRHWLVTENCSVTIQRASLATKDTTRTWQ